MSWEFDVVVDDTPLGVTFFDGLDIPLVEHVSLNGAVHTAAVRDSSRSVRVGDRLVSINHKDVTLLPTPQVLTILAELSQRLRRESYSSATGAPMGGYNRGGHEIVLRFRAAATSNDYGSGDATGPKLPAGATQGVRRYRALVCYRFTGRCTRRAVVW